MLKNNIRVSKKFNLTYKKAQSKMNKVNPKSRVIALMQDPMKCKCNNKANPKKR
jgi:hypothetical protein